MNLHTESHKVHFCIWSNYLIDNFSFEIERESSRKTVYRVFKKWPEKMYNYRYKNICWLCLLELVFNGSKKERIKRVAAKKRWKQNRIMVFVCVCAEQNSVPDIMFLYALVCMCLCASSLDEESRPEKGSFSCLPAVACFSTHDYPSHLHLSAQFTGKNRMFLSRQSVPSIIHRKRNTWREESEKRSK